MRCPQRHFNVAEFGDGAVKGRNVSLHGLLGVFVAGIGERDSDAVALEADGNRCEAHAGLVGHEARERVVEPGMAEIYVRETELLGECSRKLVFEDPLVSEQNTAEQFAGGETLGKRLLQLRVGDHPLGKQQVAKAWP